MATFGLSDVHYYDWTMSPLRVTNTASSIRTILESCLVTGLNGQAPQGRWEVQFTNGHQSALRSTHPDSSGLVHWLDDSSTGYLRARMYESMSSISVGVAGSADRYLPGKPTVTGGAYGLWTLVADSRGYYFLFSASPNHVNFTYANGLFFGDYRNVAGDSVHPGLMIMNVGTSGSATDLVSSANVNGLLTRSWTNALGNASSRYRLSEAAFNSQNNWTFSPPMGLFSLSAVPVVESLSSYITAYRGLMPGLYAPEVQMLPKFESGMLLYDVPLPTPRTLLGLGLSNAVLLLDLTGPWR